MRLLILVLFTLPALYAQTAAGYLHYSGGSLPSASALSGKTIMVANSTSTGTAGSGTYVFTSNGTTWGTGSAVGSTVSGATTSVAGIVTTTTSNAQVLSTNDTRVVASGKTPMDTTTAVALTQLPATSKGRTCEIHIWGSGASSALQVADSEVSSCYNDTASTLTITAVRCLADNSSTTTTVTPVVAPSTAILTGALTCGNGTFASGTLSGTPTLAAAGSINANITAPGTAKSVRIVITGTF